MNTLLKIALVMSLLYVFPNQSISQYRKDTKNSRIVVEGEMPPKYTQGSIELTTFPLENITYSAEMKKSQEKIVDGHVKWIFYSSSPLYVLSPFFGGTANFNFCLEPGDSICVQYRNGQPEFSGKGALKFNLIYRLRLLDDSLKNTSFYKTLSNEHLSVHSLDDYFLWNKYLNDKLKSSLSLIDSYKNKISDLIFNIVKEKALCRIEDKRCDKFSFLVGSVKDSIVANSRDLPMNQFGVNNIDLCAIYDSTLNGPAAQWLQFKAPVVEDPYYLYRTVALIAYRQRKQFFKNKLTDTSIIAKDKADEYVARYNLAKTRYTGIRREEVLAFFFHYVRGVVYKMGFEPRIEMILADYYSQPGYPEYKKAVREYELERRKILAGRTNLDFTLTDKNGAFFSKESLKGKVAILDFWFTGCKGCVQMATALGMVEERFKTDTNVVFLNVSVDEQKDKWLKSINERKYTTGNGIALYTGGEGENHPVIKGFGIDAYPSILLFNALGNPVYLKPSADPRRDSGKILTRLIEKQLVLMKDGPYVKYHKDGAAICSFNGVSVFCQPFNKREGRTLEVQTDEFNKTFSVQLKDSINIEPSEFSMPQKLIAISDIEGNLDALTQLLKVNNVIDQNYNWTFDDGHLVFAGDMFDRGNQVTECLWLLYKLEEAAKAKGGYVHFILGNHEIMNLQGDNRYTQDKYKVNAGLMMEDVAGLYCNDSELGRWLRTKNVIEKIGDLLFTHAGISSKINELKISLSDINNLARRHYDKKVDSLGGNEINVIMDARLSPFWYRGYYKNGATEEDVDYTLSKFSTNKIITGHTIVADSITTHFNGKVINIDTDHQQGTSEALLLENGIYYRVNKEGKRLPLFSKSEQGILSYSVPRNN